MPHSRYYDISCQLIMLMSIDEVSDDFIIALHYFRLTFYKFCQRTCFHYGLRFEASLPVSCSPAYVYTALRLDIYVFSIRDYIHGAVLLMLYLRWLRYILDDEFSSIIYGYATLKAYWRYYDARAATIWHDEMRWRRLLRHFGHGAGELPERAVTEFDAGVRFCITIAVCLALLMAARPDGALTLAPPLPSIHGFAPLFRAYASADI